MSAESILGTLNDGARETEVKEKRGAHLSHHVRGKGASVSVDENGVMRVKKVMKRRIKQVTHMQAFQEVWRRKQHSNQIDFAEVAAKFGMNSGTLMNYWSYWTRGLLEVDLPLSAKETELSSRFLHEKQLHLLRSMQAMLLNGCEEVVEKVRRSNAKGKLIMVEMKKHMALDMLRSLKSVDDMIASTERGYLAALEVYAETHRKAEQKVFGKEIVETHNLMTDEEKMLAALREEPAATEVESSAKVVEKPIPSSDSTTPSITSPSLPSSPSTSEPPEDGWNAEGRQQARGPTP